MSKSSFIIHEISKLSNELFNSFQTSNSWFKHEMQEIYILFHLFLCLGLRAHLTKESQKIHFNLGAFMIKQYKTSLRRLCALPAQTLVLLKLFCFVQLF